MKFKRIILVVAAAGIGCSGYAADETAAADSPDPRDMGLRISLGVAPGMSDNEYKGTDYPLDEDTGGQLEILFARRHWSRDNPHFAWIWGAGFFLAGSEGAGVNAPFAGSRDYELTALGIMGQGGIALRAGEAVVLEFQPYLGLGGANIDITGFSTGSAGYGILGLKGGLFFALSERIQLGLEAGYQFNAAVVEIIESGSASDLSLTGDGLHAAGIFAVKF